MKALVQEKEKAIAMRRQGHTYNEIMAVIPVAKSSLSLWLKDLPLTRDEKKALRHRKDTNISKGRIRSASANRKNRLAREQALLRVAKHEFEQFIRDPLFHVGLALYWAEGAKRDTMFHFMNSDADMLCLMIVWLEIFTDYSRNDLGYRLYLHQPFVRDNWEAWWQERLNAHPSQFKKTIIKPSGLGIKKRPNYRGCLRIEVPRSAALLIKMKFWINMLVEYHHKR